VALRALIVLCFVFALIVPASTVPAERIQVQLRLVPGDSLHYTTVAHMAMGTTSTNSNPSQTKVDYTMGMLVTVEEVFPDGSARVREEIDQVELAGLDAAEAEKTLGMQFTFTAHPDGSWTDFSSGDTSAASFVGGGMLVGGNGTFPLEGMDVGQTRERTIPFPLLASGQTLDVPVRTSLESLAVEDGRPAAKMKQAFNMPDTDAPVGPFGATGSARVHVAGDASYSLDLTTGWPLRMGGVVGYGIALQGEGEQKANVDINLEYALTLDQLTLSED